jgi:hypothetical protein
LTAGTRALRLAANEEAAMLVERGLGHAARLVGRERVSLQIGLLTLSLYANRDGARHAAIAKHMERAIVDAQVAGYHAEAARGLNELSFVPYIAGDYATAAELSFAAARRVRDADVGARVATLAYSAQCLVLIGHEMHEAERLAREAIELLGDDPPNEPELPFVVAMIREHQGDDAAAITLFERAVELAEKRGRWWQCAASWCTCARIELARRRPRAALEYCERLSAHAVQIGDGAEVAYGEMIGALARGVDRELEPLLARLRAADSPVHTATALVFVAERELADVALADAARHAEEAVAEAIRAGRGAWIVIAHHVAARAAEAQGRDADARVHAEAMRAVPSESLSARARSILAAT